MHLAQINIGRLLYPIDDPRLGDFVDNLDAINALAEASPGFVWRLKDDSGNATAINAFDDPAIIVNVTVWTSPEALHAFAYQTAHRRFVQRRKEWFHLFGAPYLALWWVDAGDMPTATEGRERLEHLTRFGPTPYAFTFRTPFPATKAAPLADPIDRDPGQGEAWRSCG
ncbi:MAG: DUF3291 domain-containing protein [Bauldia sp.]|nr:DUF3291 domain-containing protein [Bauldia sp.]